MLKRWPLIPVVSLAAITVASTVAASDWRSFRGAEQGGVAKGVTLPSFFDVATGENVRWRVAVPGLGLSSPVSSGELVFLTTAVRKEGEGTELRTGLYGDIAPVEDQSEYSFIVMAFDAGTGALVWQRTAHEGRPQIKRHPKSSHASSTPATDGKRVVAMFGSEGLYAYDLEGNLLWKQDLGVLDSGFFQAPSAQWGFASSPLLFGDKVILQVDVQEGSFLAAFDAATGRLLWRTERDEVPTWSSPAIAPRGGSASSSWQVVVNGFKHIGGYDLSTGEELWKLVGGGDIPVPTPVLARDVPGHGDLLLVTNAHGRMRPIYAIRTDASGEITAEPSGSSSNASTDAGPESDTEGRAIPWWHERLGNYMQTPLVLDGLGYFCFDNGVLTVLDLATGERVYQERLGRGTTGFTASPIAGDGKVYLTSEDGEVYVVAAGRNFELLGTSELGEQSMASPAVVEDRILFRGRSHLVAIGVVPGAGSENEAP